MEKTSLDFDRLSSEERYNALTEIADLYYNQGKTQVEIADRFGITRFKVAKLIQDARSEHVVEININYSNERNEAIEQELKSAYSLGAAVVVNTEYSSYIDSMNKVGTVGADYLRRILTPNSVIGVTWGKSIHVVLSHLKQIPHNHVAAVQLTGFIQMPSTAYESRHLIRTVTAAYFGTPYFLNMPLYVNNPDLRQQMMTEPDILQTLYKAKEMSVVITGIGSRSSLPLSNPKFRPYLTNSDIQASDDCIGSIYGLVLDRNGKIADIALNSKLIAVPIDDILSVNHRVAAVVGRHKIEVTSKAMKNAYVNEIITNTETALRLLDMA